MTSPIVSGTPVVINEDSDYTVVLVDCPHCRWGFAVHDEYLRKVDQIVHCPMCCQIVKIISSEVEE